MENEDARRENHCDPQKYRTYIVQSDASSASICATLESEIPLVFARTTLETMEVNVHL